MHTYTCIYIYIYTHIYKSKNIMSSNLRAEGSRAKVPNFVIYVASVVHSENLFSKELGAVGNGNKWKQSETAGTGQA